jgi:hypothetical protein
VKRDFNLSATGHIYDLEQLLLAADKGLSGDGGGFEVAEFARKACIVTRDIDWVTTLVDYTPDFIGSIAVLFERALGFIPKDVTGKTAAYRNHIDSRAVEYRAYAGKGLVVSTR